ncbi:MAG: 50S ribosomal protein L21 [Acidimicrobiia bacterium]
MYAVITTGGKQYRVEEGQQLNIELIGEVGAKVKLRPVLLVDGETIVSAPQMLAKASVAATVVAQTKGPKINGFTYKNKSNQSKRWGHRQKYSTVEITGITKG